MYYKNGMRKISVKLLILGVISLMFYGNLCADTGIFRPSANVAGEINLAPWPWGTTNWENVADLSTAPTPNDNTTVSRSSTTFLRDLYDIADHTTESGTINNVMVVARVRSTSSVDGLKIWVKTGGTEYKSDTKSVTTGWAAYFHEWATNPKTGNAWTWTDIDALQVGISLAAASYMKTTYCSQVCVYVNPSPATYYVEKTGSDANDGTNSTTDAWLTIGKAADNMFISGDIVYVGAGTYTENNVTFAYSGKVGNLTSCIAVGDVTLNATHLWDANGFYITGDYIKIEGFKIINAGDDETYGGIKASGEGIVISENTIYDNCSGIVGAGATNLTISNNSIHSNLVRGITGTGSNATIKNNLIYSNSSPVTCAGINGPGNGSEITNNTIYGNQDYGILMSTGVTGVTIKNNIITNHSTGIDCKSCALTISYNDVWGNTIHEYDNDENATKTRNISDNPDFVSTSKKTLDFHLQSTYVGSSDPDTAPGSCHNGVWGANPSIGTWEVDGVCSPCIDGGPDDPSTIEPEPNGDKINMGAFGNTAQASKNCFGITAVELISFDARPEKNYILLNWMTEAEIDNSKWLIKRAENKDADYKQITKLHAQGVPNTYIYIDSLITPGQTYWYKLGDVDKSGSITWHGPVLAKAGHKIKFSFSLKDPAANPSTGKVKLEYSIPGYQGDKQRPVTLKIYNVSGQVVKTLVDERQEPGHYTIWWDGRNNESKKVGSGTYFCHFKANGELVRKLIRIK